MSSKNYLTVSLENGKNPPAIAYGSGCWRAGKLIMYYTYVLKSKKDTRFYTGWTDNLKSRILAHNSGKVSSTASRRPFVLVYYEACQDKVKAIKREKYFKTGYGRNFLKSRV